MTELREICDHYLAFLEEEAVDGNHLKQMREIRQKLFEKGHL